jgi:hypothetical protein
MAHAPIFEVAVDEWDPRGKAPRAVTATCKKCGTKFSAVSGARAGAGAFATYLGAIHLHCPQCGAEGPVQLRRLKAAD